MTTANVNAPTPLTMLHRPAAAGTAQPWLLVLMHGVGSNEQDLFGLADFVPPQYHVISLRAPFTLGPGSYAWFQFSVEPNGTRRIHVQQEAASRAAIAQVVPQLNQRLGVPPERTVLGGFSQGGIMALSLLRTQPELMHAALVMHSRLLSEVDGLAAPAAALQGKHLWVSHGLQDVVIPLAHAHAIRERMGQSPVKLSYHEYPGGHEIRSAELQGVMGWLGEVVA
jgi:phospholipase/carboxylesterase